MNPQPTATQPAEPTGRRQPRTQTIDFTRPTKFTPDHERRLQRAIAAFCRTSSTRISAELRLPTELELAEITQLTWATAHDQLSSSSLCGVIELRPVGTQMLLAAEVGFVLTGIESLLGGPCDEPPPERRLTEIDLALAKHLFDGLLAQLEVVWRDLAGTELSLVGVDLQMQTAQVAAVSEPTLALAMEVRMQGISYALTLLVPYRAIEPVEDRLLGRNAWGDEQPGPDDRRRLRDALAGVEVALCAEIAGIEVPAARVLSIGRGEILRLNARVDRGLGLCVEGVPVLRANPGRSGTRRAVQVTDAINADGAGSLAQLAAAASAPRSGPGQPIASGPANGALNRSLGEVPVRVWAELGRTRLPLAAIVGLAPGAVIELNRRIDDPIDLYVNGLPFATGSLLVTDDSEWAVQIESVPGLKGAP